MEDSVDLLREEINNRQQSVIRIISEMTDQKNKFKKYKSKFKIEKLGYKENKLLLRFHTEKIDELKETLRNKIIIDSMRIVNTIYEDYEKVGEDVPIDEFITSAQVLCELEIDKERLIRCLARKDCKVVNEMIIFRK